MTPEKTFEAPREDALWISADVARYLQVSESWVRKASAKGMIPTVRIGALVRFDPASIRAWATGRAGGKVVPLRGR